VVFRVRLDVRFTAVVVSTPERNAKGEWLEQLMLISSRQT
jgi:hypothetical protein